MDKSDEVAPKRGRPKKEDAPSPIGQYQEEQAKKFRAEKDSNPIVETYYKLVNGHKLCLIKRKKSGKELSTFVGSIKEKHDATADYKKRRTQLLQDIKRLEASGKLKRV